MQDFHWVFPPPLLSFTSSEKVVKWPLFWRCHRKIDELDSELKGGFSVKITAALGLLFSWIVGPEVWLWLISEEKRSLFQRKSESSGEHFSSVLVPFLKTVDCGSLRGSFGRSCSPMQTGDGCQRGPRWEAAPPALKTFHLVKKSV